MSTEFGPIKKRERSDSGLSWQLSGKLMHGTVSIYRLLGLNARYNPEKNRLSFHGEANSPRSEFKAGLLACSNTMLSIVTYVMCIVLLADIAHLTSESVVGLPILLLLISFSLSLIASIPGYMQRLSKMTVFDHTQQPTDDSAVDELTHQFTNGEITQQEFEHRVGETILSENRSQ